MSLCLCCLCVTGREGAQTRVGAGKGRRGARAEYQVYSDHVDADAAHDVRRSLHVGHKQRLLQPQCGAGLVQPRRVRIIIYKHLLGFKGALGKMLWYFGKPSGGH